jgi:hypothetical protein
MEKAYEVALAQAEDEMQQLLAKRAVIDARISQLKQGIESLRNLGGTRDFAKEMPKDISGLLELHVADQMGITDAIRTLIKETALPLTAPQIRDALLRYGLDMDKYSSPLTVIHNTIKRMDKQGEISSVRSPAGEFVGWLYRRSLPSTAVGSTARGKE